MLIKAYTINAFAKTPEGGNPAGVVLHADDISAKNMKKIAGKTGASETAFIMKSNVADFEVRFFSPAAEVDLCGHATIGAFSVLLGKKIIKPGFYSQQTLAGILKVEAREDGIIMMNQATPTFSQVLDNAMIADALGISPDDLVANLPVQIVSTGLRDILVSVRSLECLNAIQPDMEKLKEISRKYKVVSWHLFTFDTLFGADAYCRSFAPVIGVPEESATGTASGALACYLNKYRPANGRTDYVFEQGFSMDRPSEILVSLDVEGSEVLEVRVGGQALGRTSIEIEV